MPPSGENEPLLSQKSRKSYTISADGVINVQTPVQMGQQELYEEIPYTAVMGLGRKQRQQSKAFVEYATELDVLNYIDITEGAATDAEIEARRKRASTLLLSEMERHGDIVTTGLIAAVAIASLTMFLFGFNIGNMNSQETFVFVGHSIGSWSIAVSAMSVGGPLGAMVGGTLADSKGRRGALLITTWVFVAGGIIQTLCIGMMSLIISRFIIGIACGIGLVLVPLYLGELAPPTLRGTLGTMTQFAIVVGILAADLLAFPLSTPTTWRYLFAVTPFIGGVQLLAASFLVESPRWLLSNDPESKEGREVIKYIRGLRSDKEVQVEVNNFLAANKVQDVRASMKEGAGKRRSSTAAVEKSVLMEMLQDKKVRLLVVSVVLLQLSQQLSGINAVFFYSNMFFEGVLDNPLVATTIVGAVNVLATYVALLLMDKCGRRTLILWSSGGMLICVAVIVLALLGYFSKLVALAAVNLYVTFFEIGLGPIPSLIVAEMFDAKYVATASSLGSLTNQICTFIVGMVFPYLNKYLGPYSFFPFGVVLCICFLFALFYLPETQGKTPQELQKRVTEKYSTIKFKNFDIEKNLHADVADLEWNHAMEQLLQEEVEVIKKETSKV